MYADRSAVVMSFSALVMCLAVTSCSGATFTQDQNALVSAAQTDGSLRSCIDDSDCTDLGPGNAFRCFQYLCYPWKDDSGVPKEEKMTTCRKNSECQPEEECVRHHDKRNVHKGLCFEKVEYCLDGDTTHCPKSYGCCNDFCCEPKYFKKLASLPCISSYGCQDLGLGQFCCPGQGDNSTAVCCDTDPNPPPTQAPSTGDASLANLAKLAIAAAAVAVAVLVV